MWEKLDQTIEELTQKKLPERVKLDAITTVTDVEAFIYREIATCRANRGSFRYLPYLERLLTLNSLI